MYKKYKKFVEYDNYICVVTWEKKPFCNIRTYVGRNLQEILLQLRECGKDCTYACLKKQVIKNINRVLAGCASARFEDKWHGLSVRGYQYQVDKDCVLERINYELERLSDLPKIAKILARKEKICERRDVILASQPWTIEPLDEFKNKIVTTHKDFVTKYDSYDPWFQGGKVVVCKV